MHEATARLRPGLLPVELMLIVALFWADEQGWIPLSKTPFLLVVAWASMRLRGITWRAAGLLLPAHWRKLAAIGVAAGIAGAAALTRYLEGTLYGITSLDAATFAVVAATFAAVAMAAAYLPARRATAIDPLVAVRHE